MKRMRNLTLLRSYTTNISINTDIIFVKITAPLSIIKSNFSFSNNSTHVPKLRQTLFLTNNPTISSNIAEFSSSRNNGNEEKLGDVSSPPCIPTRTGYPLVLYSYSAQRAGYSASSVLVQAHGVRFDACECVSGSWVN